ncbi:MAG: glycosyltransferase [Bacteroidota bacterium]|nr:glycosyltransferase [Bacteroidota bacterium]MDP4234317.1 glycosyltransferase [Bacteroidota bacterium]MDP4243251.1 glycosyltransferase [Bacteroidota bacterium]MDP4288042.1 glycosyltransferase [Bacteroidota bacterium]
MTIVIILFFAILLLNVGAFWLYQKRTHRLFHKQRKLILDSFGRIESRMARAAPEFEPAADGAGVWAIMVSFNRGDTGRRTIESLRKHEPDLPILVVDNGSTDGTRERLLEMLEHGVIQKLLLNTHEQVPQWQKSFALVQALKVLSLERLRYLVFLDDDVDVTRPFILDATTLLEELASEHVKVVNMTDDAEEEYNHPTIKRIPVRLSRGMEEIKIRASFNGQFNFLNADFFHELGYPPIAEGISELSGEDSYYSRLLKVKGYQVAVLPAARHLGAEASLREVVESKQ